MDVRSMCSTSSSVSSDQIDLRKISGFAPQEQSLPSPPLMDTVNEKKGSSLPPLTSILPPLREINPISLPPPPKSRRDTSSSNPKSPHSQVNYQRPPTQSISQRSSLTSPTSSSYSSQSSNDTNASMWSRQPPPPHPNTSYYHQPFPPPSPQYPYAPQSQQQQQFVQHYPYPPVTYPPAYATSNSYTSSGNDLENDDDDDSPYILQTAEQSLAKMGKALDHCNQIAHFASRYRDMKLNHNQWNETPQFTESNLTDMINRAYDILNILSGLRGEITSRRSNVSPNEFDLIQKQRTLGASTRTKYRKRSKRAAPPGRCHSCNISETPEWRRGPDGARTLCNACGLHFAKITRKRALTVMQQAEQQQQQQQQQAEQQQQQVAFNPPLPKSNGNDKDNDDVSDDSSDDSSNSSMPTPSASDVERDSSHVKQPSIASIEVIDD